MSVRSTQTPLYEILVYWFYYKYSYARVLDMRMHYTHFCYSYELHMTLQLTIGRSFLIELVGEETFFISCCKIFYLSAVRFSESVLILWAWFSGQCFRPTYLVLCRGFLICFVGVCMLCCSQLDLQALRVICGFGELGQKNHIYNNPIFSGRKVMVGCSGVLRWSTWVHMGFDLH